MGVKDTETKEFLKKNDVFADVFNGTVFEGKQVIDPDSLKEMDTTLTAALYGKEGKSHPVQRYRDLVKCTSAMQMENGETMYLIFAIEEQSNVNHVLPIRVMLYDALQYNSQVEEIKRGHRNKWKRQQGMDESESDGIKHLDRQTADVINVITNSKLKFEEEEGKKAVNMCKAIMDIREEGRVLQFIKDVRQFHFMDEPGMVVYLMEEFGLSKEEAEQKLKETS